MNRFLLRCSVPIFLYLFQSVSLCAQSQVDSLQVIIESQETSSGSRIEAMEELAKLMAIDKKFDKAIEIASKAQKLSHLEKDKRYGAIIQSRLSYLYMLQDSLNLAFQAIDSAEWYANRTTDKIVKGRTLNQKGWLEYMINNPDKAYENMLEALRLFEGKNTALYKSNVYHYLASIEAHWKNTEKQLYYTRLCYNEALKSKDPDALVNSSLSMGNSYLSRYRKDNTQKQLLDSSIYFNKKILKLTDSLSERITLKNPRGIAALNMANLFFEFYPTSYKDSAKVYLDIALNIGKKGDRPQLIANSYGILSEYALKEGDYDRAEELLLVALTDISNTSGNVLAKSRVTNALARVSEKSNAPSKALEYYKQYMQFDQQVFNKKQRSIAQQLEAQYQAEKREMALSAVKQEAAFSKRLMRFYYVLAIVGLITLFFLFRSYHFKLKASQQKQLLLIGEKSEAELHASLKIEETARLKAGRKLMQERLDRLEKELLAGTLQAEEKNMFFSELKEKLSTLERKDPLYKQISRLISKSYEVDKDYEGLKAEFIDIHPVFIAGLQEKAKNKLTRLDIKYCSYILMGLSNKEISIKLNVEPKSIRMARYRLKQKLNLSKEENLDEFINNLG